MSGKKVMAISGGSRQETKEGMLGAQGGSYPVRREERRPADTCLSQSWPFRAAEEQERTLGEGGSHQGRKRDPRACEEGVEAADMGVEELRDPMLLAGSGEPGAPTISLLS